jgi:lipopolysaccharide transport protein LptA
MIRIKLFISSLIIAGLSITSFKQSYAQETNFKISSDSSTIDLTNKIMTYKGNTIFTSDEISITGDELSVFKKEDDSRNLKVLGSPVKLLQNSASLSQIIELYAENIEYNLSKKDIWAKNKITLNQKTIDALIPKNNRFFKVLADELSFSSDSQGVIKMKGSPLQVSISQNQQSPLTATANELLYDQKTQAFELIGNVFLSTERDTIRAEKILYDGKIIQIPESQNQPVQMTQTIKDSND